MIYLERYDKRHEKYVKDMRLMICLQTSAVSAVPLVLLKQYKCCRGILLLAKIANLITTKNLLIKRSTFFINGLSKNSCTMCSDSLDVHRV